MGALVQLSHLAHIDYYVYCQRSVCGLPGAAATQPSPLLCYQYGRDSCCASFQKVKVAARIKERNGNIYRYWGPFLCFIFQHVLRCAPEVLLISLFSGQFLLVSRY